MVPEFAEAAFKAVPRASSPEPVKSQFGWHVIRLDDRRTKPQPEFEAVKPQSRPVSRAQGPAGHHPWRCAATAKVERLDQPAATPEPAKPADAAKPAEPKKP